MVGRKTKLFGALIGLLSGLLSMPSLSSAATTIFDSGGFQSYTTGAYLDGQFTWQVASVSSSVAAQIVTNGPNKTVAVSVSNTNAPGFWFPNQPFTVTPTENIVVVDWRQFVPFNAPGYPVGGDPFFGITVLDSNFNNTATLGMNARNGNLIIQSDDGTNEYAFSGGLDALHTYQLALNYTDLQFQVVVDGSTFGGVWDFATPSTTFDSANILTYNVTGAGTDNGIAYLDDFKVTAVPEPAAFSLVGLAMVAMGLRRKRNLTAARSA